MATVSVPTAQALSLDDLPRVLSVAQFSAREDEVMDRYSDVTTAKEDKHMRLLDTIALFPVQKKDGDVAVVMSKFFPDPSNGSNYRAIIFFFLEEPCSSAEWAGINSIIRYLRDVQINKITGDFTAGGPLESIVHNCASKVKDEQRHARVLLVGL